MEKFGEIIELADTFLLLVEAKKIHGPYHREDGRQIVIIINDDGSRRTVSYPKYIMEQHLNRELDQNTETVDHIDRDHNNNDLSNLRLVPRDQHSADDTRRVKMLDLTCPMCEKIFQRSPRLVRDKTKKGKVSTFCSRQCAGKYSREVQLGLRERLPVQESPNSIYYRNIKDISADFYFLLKKYG